MSISRSSGVKPDKNRPKVAPIASELVPNDGAAERRLLGSIFLWWGCWERIDSVFQRVTVDDFYGGIGAWHGYVFSMLGSLATARVSERALLETILRDKKRHEMYGEMKPAAEIARLIDSDCVDQDVLVARVVSASESRRQALVHLKRAQAICGDWQGKIAGQIAEDRLKSRVFWWSIQYRTGTT